MSGWTVADTTPALSGTCTNNGTAVAITGATLEAHIQKPDGTVLTKSVSIISGPGGTWQAAAWVGGDLNVAGPYTAEVQVTFSGGAGIQTFPADPFYVSAQIA